MPVAEAYARKFGGPERAAAIIDNITSIAAAEGLDFRLDRARRANTRDAHRVLDYAADAGAPGTQAALKERLLPAYFTNGEDIGDPMCWLARPPRSDSTATRCGQLLDSETGLAELQAAAATAAEAGITAVPTYVIDGRWSIPGAQDPDVFVQVLRRLAARAS